MTASPDSTLPTDISADGLPALATTRRRLLALGAIAATATVVLPALPARALNMGLAAQLKWLENAEFFQNQFFARALRSGSIDPISSAEAKAVMTIARQDDEQGRWFRAVRAQRGLMPMRSTMPSSITDPNFRMNTNYASREKFFASAITIKSTAVGAFHGLVGMGKSAEMTQAFAALAGVQNRHLALLKELAGLNPFDALVEPISLAEASKTLSRFGFDAEAGL